MTNCCGSPDDGSFDFKVRQGTSLVVRWPVTLRDGTPVDVSTWTLRAQVRPRASSPVILHEWNAANGNVVTNSSGELFITMTPDETSAITWRRGVYDVELEDPAGNVTAISHGRICVDREVTR